MSADDYVRRLLIISVGSSASIHLLGGVASQYPDLLFKNRIMIVETSRKMFSDAIDHLTTIYKRNYAKIKGKSEEELKEGFPFSKFKSELKENSVLLAEGGGGATPEKGLAYYNEKKDEILAKITELIAGETGEREISGIVILGCAGKGTGTLITPALARDLMREPDVPKPIAFLTIPFRFDRMSIDNASKIRDFLREVPLFLLDYERAIGGYVYLSGQVPRRDIAITHLYKMVVGALSNVLSTLIEALNYSIECNPPLDWSDIIPILQPGDIGTVTYSLRFRREDFMTKWKNDLSTLLLLRTRSRPTRTRSVAIIRGIDVPLGIVEEITDYMYKFLGSSPRLYILNRGPDFRIIVLVHGFSPEDISPPLVPGKGILQRILGL